MRSDEDLDDFLYKKDRYRDRLNFVTLKQGPSGRQYENISLICLPPNTTESARPTLRGRVATLQTFGG